MSFTVPNFAQIRERNLATALGLNPTIAVDKDSDYYIRASGHSSSVEGLYQHQQWVARQIFPDTADIDSLTMHCATRYITRKGATAATGVMRVTAPAGTVFTAGSQANDANGLAYQLTATATVGAGGSVDIPAAAMLPGTLSNQTPNYPVNLIQPPSGATAAAVLLTMDSGADIETPASLLARYLDVVRYPSAGGNKFDWQRWALEVPGVADAFVYDLRRGAGTVDTVILSSTGLPSVQLIADVTAHVESVRPLGLRGWSIIAPDALVMNVTGAVSLDGTRSMAQVQADFSAALTVYLMSQKPGTVILKSVIETILSGIAGVSDRVVTAPAANVTPLSNAATVQWVQLGAVTLTQLV